jgi:hypothetical protein
MAAFGRYCYKKSFRIPTRNIDSRSGSVAQIDSKGALVGFESCSLGEACRLLQQYRPIADIKRRSAGRSLSQTNWGKRTCAPQEILVKLAGVRLETSFGT